MPLRRSPLFSWLSRWRDDELRGRLTDIFVADDAGAPMRRVGSCRCLPGLGIEGDRYAAGLGHWRQTDGCEVTLVRHEDLVAAERRLALGFLDGRHRRNLVVSGIPLAACQRRRVRIGEVLFAFHRLRPPCAYLDRVSGPGAARALARGAGIGLRVLEGGTLRVGDPVTVIVDDGQGG